MAAAQSKTRLVSVFLLLLLCIAQICAADSRSTHRKAATKQAEPETPPPPPPPLTLEQKPAVPPQVTYQGGMLTIVAENSTLGDILRSVQSQTKAQVDVPANATERVVGQFGPGPACEVLASLLKGSHFNYVLAASDSNPSNLGRVILTSKTGGDAASGGGTPAQAGMRPVQPNYPQPGGMQAQAQEQDDMQDSGDEVVDDSAAEQEEPEQQPDDASQEDQQAQQQQNGTAPPGVKTPEQLLQELQQRQQQMGQPGQPVNQGFPPATAPNAPPQQPPQQ